MSAKSAQQRRTLICSVRNVTVTHLAAVTLALTYFPLAQHSSQLDATTLT